MNGCFPFHFGSEPVDGDDQNEHFAGNVAIEAVGNFEKRRRVASAVDEAVGGEGSREIRLRIWPGM